MSNVFDTAMQVLFADANLAKEATFIPLQGQSRSVRVITRAPDVYQNVGQSVVHSPSLVLEVQVSDCPAIVQGDGFLLDSITYIVQGEPRRDSERLVWQVDLYAS